MKKSFGTKRENIVQIILKYIKYIFSQIIKSNN